MTQSPIGRQKRLQVSRRSGRRLTWQFGHRNSMANSSTWVEQKNAGGVGEACRRSHEPNHTLSVENDGSRRSTHLLIWPSEIAVLWPQRQPKERSSNWEAPRYQGGCEEAILGERGRLEPPSRHRQQLAGVAVRRRPLGQPRAPTCELKVGGERGGV